MAQTTLGAVQPAAATDPAGAGSCQRPAHSFVPTRAVLPSLGRTVGVIQVPRTRDNAVGAGPLTQRGKWLMAMDPHTRPGGGHGTVILSGHTWPDGSALGNAMLANLQVGDRVSMLGRRGQRACYRITERTSFPANRVPSRTVFRSRGPERLVIVSCSGVRTGPGHWTRRTVWYAAPVAPAPPRPSSSAPPPPPSNSTGTTSSGSTGLLGGLLGGLFGGG